MQKNFWVKNGALGENGRKKRDFGLKLVFWGKMAIQRDFWVKMGF